MRCAAPPDEVTTIGGRGGVIKCQRRGSCSGRRHPAAPARRYLPYEADMMTQPAREKVPAAGRPPTHARGDALESRGLWPVSPTSTIVHTRPPRRAAPRASASASPAVRCSATPGSCTRTMRRPAGAEAGRAPSDTGVSSPRSADCGRRADWSACARGVAGAAAPPPPLPPPPPPPLPSPSSCGNLAPSRLNSFHPSRPAAVLESSAVATDPVQPMARAREHKERRAWEVQGCGRWARFEVVADVVRWARCTVWWAVAHGRGSTSQRS